MHVARRRAFAASDGRKEYNCETVRTAPFNSTNKYSAATVKGDFNTTFVKGAAEKITVNPISTVTSGISFDIDEYGLYYLRTEVICHEHSIYAVDDTEFSYVNSDRQTVNPDFGTSAQVLIFSDSVSNEESIAKNAGIGMIRWVRSMSDVMNLTYGENSQTLTKKGFGAWKKYDEFWR